ncbi:MAG: hypothetical protein R3B93_25140 [Bacteroidia bacterium]
MQKEGYYSIIVAKNAKNKSRKMIFGNQAALINKKPVCQEANGHKTKK